MTFYANTGESLRIYSDGGITTAPTVTGGNKGAGTINAIAVYDDGTLLTDYVFDAFFGVKNHFNPMNFDVKWYSDYWKREGHLATIPTWKNENAPSIGQQNNQLRETVEVQAILIKQLHDRISALEGIAIA